MDQSLEPSPTAATSPARTQAVFVNKLYKMLEDTSIQHLISWSKKGDQFNVPNPTTFSRTVLPQYFKHSNWQSFVRQLNMYGFHKVNDMIHANSSHQTWEFKHPYFKRGAIEDLQYIKRKNNNPNNITKARMIPDLQNDCSVYNHLIHVEDRLTHAVRTYQMLQNEMIMLKTLLSKQHGTMIEFAQLFSDVVQDRNITDGKRELILNKLHQLQIVLNTTIDYVDGGSASNSSNSSNSSSSSSSSNTISSTTTCSHSSDGNHLDTNGSRSSSINSINSNSDISSDRTITAIQKLSFGKESHLLNPENQD